jgi:hypothetical protein
MADNRGGQSLVRGLDHVLEETRSILLVVLWFIDHVVFVRVVVFKCGIFVEVDRRLGWFILLALVHRSHEEIQMLHAVP